MNSSYKRVSQHLFALAAYSIISFLLTAGIVACTAASAPVLSPTETPSPTLLPPSQVPSPSASATSIPSPTARPTLFITPPAAGQPAAIPVLMYHHLAQLPQNPTPLETDWTVAPNAFESQMKGLIARGFHSITISQLAAFLTGSQPLPTKPIAITFDDGWVDDYSVAFSILKTNHLVGTFFVYTNVLGHPKYLSWAQLKEMSDAGMEIGSHTLSHAHLKALAHNEAVKEVADSKKLLEQRLGKSVFAFAYPFGEYNSDVTDMVKKAGYKTAVTIAAGYNQRADALYQLHRIRVSYGDTLEDLFARLP